MLNNGCLLKRLLHIGMERRQDVAATWAERWRPLTQCIKICSPLQIASRLLWVMPSEHDHGNHKTCWGETGAELV